MSDRPGYVIAVLLLIASASAADAVDVTACGQHVGPGETGVLQSDVDCTASAEPIAAVYLGNRATLSLNGHTIIARADIDGVLGDVARRCTIEGPGTITGARTAFASGQTRMTIRDVTLVGNRGSIDVPLGRVDLTDVTASSSVGGVRAETVRATRVTVTTNGGGDCILGGTFRGTDVTVTGCHTGIAMQYGVRATRLDDRDNVTVGVVGSRVRLVDSVVTGNTFLGQPLDLLSRRRPSLLLTTCDASAQLIDQTVGPAWGVCAGD